MPDKIENLHFTRVSVKVVSGEPVSAGARLRGLVAPLMMSGDVVLTIFCLGAGPPLPCPCDVTGHVSDVTGHVRDVTRGEALGPGEESVVIARTSAPGELETVALA